MKFASLYTHTNKSLMLFVWYIFFLKMESSCLLLASGTQGNQLNPFFFRVRLPIFFLQLICLQYNTIIFQCILKSIAIAGKIGNFFSPLTCLLMLSWSLLYLQPSIITKLPKFEVDLPSHQKSTKQPLLERDVSMANM